jgi:succinoglycan biosynthesis transport protein ExoP
MRPGGTPVRPLADDGLDTNEEGSLSWGQVQHLLHAPLRHPLMVALPWAGVLALSVAALFILPKKYRSSALILVESEKVPDSFVTKVATQDNSGRLENIKPEILSRTRLERVLAETNPYPEIDSKTRAVETLREAIAINQSGSDGFTLEFIHREPRKAQEVTDRLATLFIGESVKSREAQVEDAVDFLVTQVDASRKELEEKDAALRRYKEQRMGRLPEQLQTNLATLEMLQREKQTVEESLYLAREKQDALARGVSRPSPAAARSGGAPPEPTDIETMRDQLALMRSRYTDEHPDVQSLRSRIARAEAKRAAMPASEPDTPVDTSAAVTREQLRRAQEEVLKLEERQADLERRVTATRARVEDTPRTEQELSNMTRDYEKLNENYSALLSKQLDAQMAGRLERRWKGDRFRMLDPAHLPEKPDSPKPVPILGLGAVLGLLLGLGVSVMVEILDPTVKDAEQLQGLLPYPVLARIPHLAGPHAPKAA